MNWPNLEELIRSHRTLICVGSGGVGKTTISAALGIRAAQMGLRVLVMTIDPSLRLKQALGIASASGLDEGSVIKVPEQKYLGTLDVTLMNPEAQFKKFISQSSPDNEMTARLLKNRLYKQLSTTLSGSQEFTSLLQLLDFVEGDQYDLIILDTPPAQHAIEFLEAPHKITTLFQEKIVNWFIGDVHEAGFFRRVLSRGTHALFLALEKVTGSQFMKELNDFFISVRVVQSQIADKANRIDSVLRSPLTQFLLVTGFDAVKLNEAQGLQSYLEKNQYSMGGVIVNRAFPEWQRLTSSPHSTELSAEYGLWQDYHHQREKIYGDYIRASGDKLHVVRIPDLNEDIKGLVGLEVISDELQKAFSKTNE